MAVNNVIRMLNLTRGLNTDGDVDSDSLADKFVSNNFFQNTDKFVSNNFFQNTSTLREGEVIEEYYVPADGRQIATVSGTANTEQVTGTQSFTNAQQKITGSEITGYKVPSGTKYVHYGYKVIEFARTASIGVDMQIYLYYKVNGGAYNLAGYHGNMYDFNAPIQFDFVLEVGASSANAQLGTITESTPTLDIKLEARGRQSTQGGNLHTPHGAEPWGTPATPGSFAQPYVFVKAIAGS